MGPNIPDLFHVELRQIPNLSHPLWRLAAPIDWSALEQASGPLSLAEEGYRSECGWGCTT
jgi:hypothetical protein